MPSRDSTASSTRARARGGAWATNDNPYEFGHLYYSFHDGGACFAFSDGSVGFIAENITLRSLACLTTRSGGEIVTEDY